jgi:peptidyl-prolyl cis-trans isomerase C
MPSDLNLTLPDGDRKPPAGPRPVLALLGVLAILAVANLVVAWGRSGRPERPAARAGLPAEEEKTLALKLERQGLGDAAAEAWKGYLSAARLDPREQANVWYRIGKICQEAGRHEKALDAYYRSESLAKVDELAPEIGRRTQDCLEALGKFAALRHERADRAEQKPAGAPAGGEVVAEIGREKITKGRLDRMIEEQIERQLAQFAAALPPDQRRQQKEAMLQRLASAQAREQLLHQFITRELLYRQAREAKLAEDPGVRDLLADAEKSILAQQAMERELGDKIRITESDLRTYYAAHQKEYAQPERAQISHLLAPDEKSADAALKRLRDGAAFDALAKELSADAATKEKGGAIDGWVEKGAPIPGVGSSPDAAAAVFATEAGKTADKVVKSDKGFHVIHVRQREPERQKPFDEVRQDVYRALRSAKERDVQHDLFERLKARHAVVIHPAATSGDKPATPKPDAPPGAKKADDAKKK